MLNYIDCIILAIIKESTLLLLF